MPWRVRTTIVFGASIENISPRHAVNSNQVGAKFIRVGIAVEVAARKMPQRRHCGKTPQFIDVASSCKREKYASRMSHDHSFF